MVGKFVSNLNANPEIYIFAAFTCDITPGIAFNQLNDILSEKMSIKVGFTFIMPANNMTWRAPQSETKQRSVFEKSEEVVKAAVESIEQ